MKSAMGPDLAGPRDLARIVRHVGCGAFLDLTAPIQTPTLCVPCNTTALPNSTTAAACGETGRGSRSCGLWAPDGAHA